MLHAPYLHAYIKYMLVAIMKKKGTDDEKTLAYLHFGTPIIKSK